MEPPAQPPHRERRRAVVVFADLSGFTSLMETLGDEPAEEIVTGCLDILGDIAVQHGGRVHQYEGDCIMVLFGAPQAIEGADHAALNCAIAMRKAADAYSRRRSLQIPLTVHAGINGGWLVAGHTLKHVADAFDVKGDTVNVAARLKDKAPSRSIYVGPGVYREARGDFRFRQLEPMPLKGKAKSLPIYELLSDAPHPFRAPGGRRHEVQAPFTGRQQELSRLRRRAAATAGGAGGAVALVGEPGLGKSALLGALCSSSEALELTRLEARALPVGERLSLHVVADLLRAWIRTCVEPGQAAEWPDLGAAVDDLLGASGRDAAPLIARIMGIKAPDEAEATLSRIPHETLEAELVGAVHALLAAMARRRPVLLLLDDLHWADASSVRMLGRLLSLTRSDPILFALAMRPRQGAAMEPLLRGSPQPHARAVEVLHLEPLDTRTQRKLVSALLEGAGQPPDLLAYVEQRAAGNPFFAEEIVRAILHGAAGHDLPATTRIQDLPGSIHDLVMSRVDGLPDEVKRVIQAAAVIGRSFSRPVLVHVLDRDDLDEHLDVLRELQLISDVGSAAAPEHAFRHPLIQEIVYESLLGRERAQLHARAAEAVAACLKKDTPGYHGMLAYHYELGDDTTRAEAALDRAGDAAVRLAASDEAVYFFGQAVDRLRQGRGAQTDPDRLATLERKLGEAFMNRGDLTEAVGHFDQALALLAAAPPSSNATRALRLARTAVTLARQIYLPLRIRPKARATDRDRTILAVMYARAQAQTTTRPAAFLGDTLENLVRLSRVSAESVERAGAMYASAVGIFSYGGISFRISRTLLEIGQGEVREDDPSDLLTFRLMRFLHHYLAGEWSEANLVDAEPLDANLQIGRLWEVATYLNLEAAFRIYRGEFEQADLLIERLGWMRERYRYELAASAHDALLTYLALERRQLPDALARAQQYLELHPAPLFNLIALGTIAKIEVLQGRVGAAEATVRRARRLMDQTPGVLPYHRNHVVYADLLVLVSHLEVVDSRMQRRTLRRELDRQRAVALRMARRFGPRRPEIYRTLGTGSWCGGRRREALRWWRRSVAEAEALGMLAEKARTLAEIARFIEHAPPSRRHRLDAQDLRSAAEAIFRRLDLAWDLEQLSAS